MTRVLFITILLLPATCSARWPTGTPERLHEAQGHLREAEARTGVPASLLGAVAAHETGFRPVRGRWAAVYGVGQVSWRWHAKMLRSEGVARTAEDLLGVRAGVLAMALVLRHIGRTYPRAPLWRRLCIYGVGTRALRFEESCAYSRAVLANVPRVVRTLSAPPSGARPSGSSSAAGPRLVPQRR